MASAMSGGRSEQLDRATFKRGPWDALCWEGQKGPRAETVAVQGRECALHLVLDGMAGSEAHGLGPSPTRKPGPGDRRGPELGRAWRELAPGRGVGTGGRQARDGGHMAASPQESEAGSD